MELVHLTEVEDLCRKALTNMGHLPQDVEPVCEGLLWAQRRGNNQGIIKIPAGAVRPQPSAGKVTTVFDTKLSARLDAQQRPGIVAVQEATKMAIQKAREHGFGMVRNQEGIICCRCINQI
ncbi:unnamed protein product [Vitrella brassicaformis CCMP3155]|uniref:Uncharacterized protein n=1 Tax=Vitrella brassicaformis (strain CCMP3155) TaxID=1169540 RepID=A0A0G4GHX3_VITBC|nr:unnamed protein product [Vitrella brassicaformis CCMP3155]|eukprot:CEM29208.1 unnamed protein product [Vitrella brassicaformis CCMP3155]